MNYYEELGVRQDASVEEIRQAYKLMTRLLHPDRHVEPALKQVAERQMQRLGESVAILLDPEKRSHYDELVLLANRLQNARKKEAISAPEPAAAWDGGNRVAGFALRYWSWILTGILGIALTAWSFMQPNAAVLDRELHWAASQRESAAGNGAGQPIQKASQPAHRIAPGIAKGSPVLSDGRVPAAEKTVIPVTTLPEAHVSVPFLVDLPPRVDGAPEIVEEAAKPLLESLPPLRLESSFVGRWLYSPQAGDEAEGVMYPAIYVELSLVERDGELAGDYRARYKVRDKAVSPEVIFKVRGKAGSTTSAKFAWVAGDNAKGMAEMTLREPHVLCITWWTSEFGRQATLGSGTAVLIRQQVP